MTCTVNYEVVNRTRKSNATYATKISEQAEAGDQIFIGKKDQRIEAFVVVTPGTVKPRPAPTYNIMTA